MSRTPGRSTRIVVTPGPVSETRDCLAGLVRAGMDTVRLAMSSRPHEGHAALCRLVREVAADAGRPIGLMADLQDRKNRLGALPGGRARWQEGETVVLSSRRDAATSHRTWISRPWSVDLLLKSGRVLIDDGAVLLEVTDADRDAIRCLVVQGGTVTSGRGVTLPGATRFPDGLTRRDEDDLACARDLGVDTVALSFACSAAQYDSVRALAPGQQVIAKVEHYAGVAALPELAAVFDGLMVARGDLGIELPAEEVPFVQRAALRACARLGKVSMVATHLLHSMRTSTMPTRAEVSDLTHAVLQGAGAVVLTGETGYGRHPVAAVETARRVIERAEQADLPCRGR